MTPLITQAELSSIQSVAKNASMVKAAITKMGMYVEAGVIDSLLAVAQSLVNRIGVEKPPSEETNHADASTRTDS